MTKKSLKLFASESRSYKAPGVHGKNGEKTYCSFCGKSVTWRKYSEHLDKEHPRKPESGTK